MELEECKLKIKEIFQVPEFKFFEYEHKYFYKDKELKSVTRFVKEFESIFDPHGFITFACAKKENISVQELKGRWFAKAKNGREIGTDVHKIIDNFWTKGIRRDEFSDAEPVRKQRLNAFWNLYDNELCKWISIDSEQKIFSIPLEMAGTIDKRFLVNGRVRILDWKTNDELKDRRDFMRSPFSDLKDSDYNRYSLQMSLYSLMMTLHGFDMDDTYLAWLKPIQGELIKLIDFRDRLKDVLKYKLEERKIGN